MSTTNSTNMYMRWAGSITCVPMKRILKQE